MQAWARLTLLALVIFGFGALVPSQAGATLSFYDCTVAHDTWCDGRANGSYDGENSWDYNEAANNTGVPFVVCQRVYKPSTGVWLDGNSCDANWSGNDYGNILCVCYDAQIKQQSGTSRWIIGFADSE